MNIKITNAGLLGLHDAIQALDGTTVTQLVDGRPVAVFRGYRLSHGARWNLARNLGRLQSAIADFNRAKASLIRQHTDGEGAISAAHPRFREFADEFEALARQPVELELEGITLADLKLEANEQAGNELPIGVLNGLRCLIAAEAGQVVES